MSRNKTLFLIATLIVVLAADIITKRWALSALGDGTVLHLFGGAVPLTLAFNKGAAFSLNIGAASRWVFTILSIVVLWVLAGLYRQTPGTDRVRLSAIALVVAGAIGNLIDRIRWDRGVVDFIGPIDLGFMYWPIFNVADMAITCGAVLLAFSLVFEEREPSPETQS